MTECDCDQWLADWRIEQAGLGDADAVGQSTLDGGIRFDDGDGGDGNGE